jgi:hypothetical protein
MDHQDRTFANGQRVAAGRFIGVVPVVMVRASYGATRFIIRITLRVVSVLAVEKARRS